MFNQGTAGIVSENEFRKQESKMIDDILNKTEGGCLCIVGNAKITLYVLLAIQIVTSIAMIIGAFVANALPMAVIAVLS